MGLYRTDYYGQEHEPSLTGSDWPDHFHPSSDSPDDLRDFCLMLRRALYMVIRWIEDKYGGPGHTQGSR